MDKRTVKRSLSPIRFEKADPKAVAAAVADIVEAEAARAVAGVLGEGRTEASERRSERPSKPTSRDD